MTEASPGRYKWLALFTVSLGTFMATLDSSIVNIALPQLAEVFDTEPSVVLWVTVAYLLVSVGLTLTLGRLGDALGRKRIYVTGLVLFTVGLTLCSVSQSVVQLILARVVQATGLSMIVAVGNAIITAVFPDENRGKALGILGGIVSAGLLSGPALGGLLLDLFDWRALFYLRIPVSLIALAMAATKLREQPKDSSGFAFDWKGAATLFGGLSCFLLFVNLGGRMGFGEAPVLILGGGAAVLLAGFIRIERRAPHPILNLALFRNRLFAAGIVSMGAMFVAAAASTFLGPFYLIEGTGRTAAEAGLVFAVTPASGLIVGPLSGWLSDRIGYRVLCTLGAGFITAGLFLLSRLGMEASTADIVLRFVVLGVGIGMFSSPNNSSVMGSVPQERLSTASAMIATTRQTGMSSGMAIAGAIFTSREAFHATRLAGQGLSAGVIDSMALISGYQDSLTVAAIICSVAIVASWLRGRRKAEAADAADAPAR
jgi:EmrB/QacA subfamily drug resistance transporter